MDGAIGVGGAPNRSRVIDCVFSAEGRSRGPVSVCGQVSSEATRQRAVDIEDVPRRYMITLSDTLTFNADPQVSCVLSQDQYGFHVQTRRQSAKPKPDGPLGGIGYACCKEDTVSARASLPVRS